MVRKGFGGSGFGLVAALLLATSALADFVPGQVETRTLEWQGGERFYDVYQPPGEVPAEGLPVVFDFHGFGSTKEDQRTVLNPGLQQLSNTQHFLMVWPQGIGDAWNAGTCCTAPGDPRDDVGFVAAILDVVAAEAPIDTSRIYATGLSNGSAMSHRLACDSADLFAAVGPVAFPLPFFPLSGCQPSRPISVDMVMGLTDVLVPYNGGGINGPARDSFSYWRDTNGCGPGEADSVTLLVGPSQPFQRCETYTSCSEGVEVRLCSIVGIAFTGPLASFSGHLLYFNQSSLDVASETWNFMSRFQHPDPPVLPAPEPGVAALHATALLVLLTLKRARTVRARQRLGSKRSPNR